MDWPELLEEMEARLAATERTLLEGASPPSRIVIHPGMPPLPEELRERAMKVLDETQRLASRVRAARDRLSSARLHSLTRARVPSAFVDTRT